MALTCWGLLRPAILCGLLSYRTGWDKRNRREPSAPRDAHLMASPSARDEQVVCCAGRGPSFRRQSFANQSPPLPCHGGPRFLKRIFRLHSTYHIVLVSGIQHSDEAFIFLVK